MCVELVLILTMHKLTLGLKLITGTIRQDKVKRREYIGLIITLVYLCDYLAVDLVGFTILKKEQKIYRWEVYWLIASFIVLNLMYTFVIVSLYRVMGKMTGDFEKEIRSVKW